MAESNVPVTPGSGANVDTFTQTSGDHRQAVVIGDANGAATQKVNANGDAVTSLSHPLLAALGISAGLTGYGAQRVSPEPSNLFSDVFDGAFDAMKWVTGGTVAPSVVGGRAILEPGSAPSASSNLVSVPVFTPPGSSWIGQGMVNRFENNTAGAGAIGFLNAHRFLGNATAPPTWVAAYSASATSGPILNGYGFEIDTDGNMYAAIYDNGTRTRADAIGQATGEKRLNLGRTLFNGELHQFTIVMRPDAVFWYIDGQDLPAALLNYRTAGYPVPDQQTLPLRLHTINATTAPTGTMWNRPGAVALADTGHNNIQISDGAYPWRDAGITDLAVIPGVGRAAMREQTWGNALNVNLNAVQLATFKFVCKPATSAPTTANVWKSYASLHHLASATRTIRIRRIEVSVAVSALAQSLTCEVHRITAVPTGTTVAANTLSATASLYGTDPRDTATEAVGINTAVATSAGILATGFVAASSTAALHGGGSVIYDWDAGAQMKAITLRAGVLEGVAVGFSSSALPALTPTVEITYTEE